MRLCSARFRAVSNTNNGHAVNGQVLNNLHSKLKKLEDKVDEPAPVLAAAQVQVQPDANQTAEINALKAQISGFEAKVGQMNRSKDLKETLNQIVQAEFKKAENSAEAAEKLQWNRLCNLLWLQSTYWLVNGSRATPTIRCLLFIAYFPTP